MITEISVKRNNQYPKKEIRYPNRFNSVTIQVSGTIFFNFVYLGVKQHVTSPEPNFSL